ncbi:unnamed protein product, partial [Discosporangium mesarthrocarpum]
TNTIDPNPRSNGLHDKGHGQKPEEEDLPECEKCSLDQVDEAPPGNGQLFMPFAARELQTGTSVWEAGTKRLFAGPLQLHVPRGAGEQKERDVALSVLLALVFCV